MSSIDNLPSVGQVPVRLDARPATLLDCARALYERRPEHTALTLIEPDGQQAVSYRALFERAACYAAALERAGVGPGDLVVLVLQHGGEVIYSFWGAMLLSAVPSIMPFLTPKLNPATYFESIRQLVALSGVRAVITYAEMQPALAEHLAKLPSCEILSIEALDGDADLSRYLERAPSRAEDTAFLQHSSGSTGLQKGVMLSHGAVLNQIAAYSAAIELSPEDVVASWLPLYHDMGLIAGFIMPIVQGIPLVLMSPFQWVREPGILLSAIQEHRATLCWLPNFAYNFLATRIRRASLEGVDLSSLRALINCSEPVRAESHQVFLERYAAHGATPEMLQTCYAMAENTFAVTQSALGAPPPVDVVQRRALMDQRRAEPLAGKDGSAVHMVSCGRPIPGTAIRVVDAERRDLPERHVGEIALRSDCMLSGYYHRDDATAEALRDGWYFTGDLGYIAEGELYITGRQKDLIIVGGKNIYPQDIEAICDEVPGVHPGRTVAFGVLNESLGTEDIAVVCEAETADPDTHKEIVREIRTRIAQATDTMAHYVHLVEPMWLLKTSSGKIARTANRDKFLRDVLGRAK